MPYQYITMKISTIFLVTTYYLRSVINYFVNVPVKIPWINEIRGLYHNNKKRRETEEKNNLIVVRFCAFRE